MKLRQGAVFKSQRVAKARGVTAVREAVARGKAAIAAQIILDALPDDPMVTSLVITGTGAKHAELTDRVTAASLLSAEAGRLCPHGVELVTVQSEAQRVFGGGR